MDCLTDTNCLNDIFATMNQIAATIDYIGYVVFGDVWPPIGPEVEVRTDAIASMVNEVLFQEPSGCGRYTTMVTKHA